MPADATHPVLPLLLLFGALLLVIGCADAEAPPAETTVDITLETKADSVAMQLYEALGGPQAWAALPVLRFDFGGIRDGQTRIAVRHLWNRQTGDYRVEWSPGPDSTYVALFNVAGAEGVPEGRVYLNGAPVAEAQRAPLMERAYQRFINDTYWLLAPVKLFDPGVRRTYAADSSSAEMHVLHLTFDEVGLTPGDQYWLFVDRETGRLHHWAFHLQGMDDEAAPRRYRWTGYEQLATPAGPVTVATRKEAMGSPGGVVTEVHEMPSTVADSMFTAPMPILDL